MFNILCKLNLILTVVIVMTGSAFDSGRRTETAMVDHYIGANDSSALDNAQDNKLVFKVGEDLTLDRDLEFKVGDANRKLDLIPTADFALMYDSGPATWKGKDVVATLTDIFKTDGSRDVTGQITSTFAAGAPLVVVDNTVVANFNANFLQGNLASAFALSAHTHTFLNLTDVPASYVGEGLKVARVNAGETAIEFAVASAAAFLDMTDTPASYATHADKTVSVNAGATALEFRGPWLDQDVRVASSPTFGGLTVDGNVALTSCSTFNVSDSPGNTAMILDGTLSVGSTCNVVGLLTANNRINSMHTGSSPFLIADNALNVNLNADLLDSLEGAAYVTKVELSSTAPGSPGSELVGMAAVGTPTLTTLEDLQTIFHSAGWAGDGLITDAGAGNIDVAFGCGAVRTSNLATAQLQFFDWPASLGLAIPADTTRFIGVEYNAGTPQVTVRSAFDFNNKDDFILGIVTNEAGTLHVENAPFAVGDHAANMIQRLDETVGIARDKKLGGLLLGETGTRNITVSLGALWDYLSRFPIPAIDTSVADDYDRYYQDGVGGWTRQAAVTTWDNTQYDDGTGVLATLGNNKWAVQWFYLELDGDLVSLYGQTQSNSHGSAEDEFEPVTLPDRLAHKSILIGRLIFKKSESTAETIESAFASDFGGDLGGTFAEDVFKTISCPLGTNPVADGNDDTLTLTTANAHLTITGDSATDTVDFAVVTGTSGTVIPLLDGANTWSGVQTFGTNTKLQFHDASQFIHAIADNVLIIDTGAVLSLDIGGTTMAALSSTGLDVVLLSKASTFESDVVTGTAPIVVASTTECTLLNAAKVGGLGTSDFVLVDGSQALTADWDVGAFDIRAAGLRIDADPGGLAGTFTYGANVATGQTGSTLAPTLAGVKETGPTAFHGWVKDYDGTTIVWTPLYA